MAETGSKFLPSSRGDSAYLLQRWIPNGYGVNLNSRLCFDFGTATENASGSTSYTHKGEGNASAGDGTKTFSVQVTRVICDIESTANLNNLQVQAKGLISCGISIF
jgi:hypothetical protein